ncbi:MAG: MGMT family protein [bacterium]|nr:MGMT family protein [bacterium]
MTPFEILVYQETKSIAPGRVKTYKEIAVAIGRPLASRAVGNALYNNTDPNVPCHRVVRSGGAIGGFRYGTQKKKTLLKKEGVLVIGSCVLFKK